MRAASDVPNNFRTSVITDVITNKRECVWLYQGSSDDDDDDEDCCI